MYRVKETQKRQNQLRFQAYAPLNQGEDYLDRRISEIQAMISAGKFEESIDASTDLFSNALGGLRYLQTYDWLFLRTIVTAGYLGWIAYALTTVIDLHVLHGSSESNRTWFTTSTFIAVLVGLFSIFMYQQSSWRYYVYGIFPVFFWEEVFARRKALKAGSQILLGHVQSIGGYVIFLVQSTVFLGILEALVSRRIRYTEGLLGLVTPRSADIVSGSIVLSARDLHHLFYHRRVLAPVLWIWLSCPESITLSGLGNRLYFDEHFHSLACGES
jgi:phosphatidylinositol glycan class N